VAHVLQTGPRMKLTPFILAVSLAHAIPASADDAEPAGRPSFPHLGPDGVANERAGGLGLSIADPDAYLIRLGLRAQAVSTSGFGVYGSLAAGGITNLYVSDKAFGLGGLELGGLYHVAASSELDATFRAGVVLPTDAGDVLGYAVATVYQDPSNVVNALPARALRVAVTPTWHRDRVYLRADLGADLARGDGMDVSMVHADLAVALAPSPIGGAFEIQTLCIDQVDDCVHLFAATVQFQSQPGDAMHVGVGLPVMEDDLGEVYTLEAGYTSRF
jgi:hypothetical protein